MASIVPIPATQNTEQSVSAASGEVNLNCDTAALEDGVVYLIDYTGNHGGSDTSAVSQMRLRFGSTVLTGTEYGNSVGEGRGLDNHWDSGHCCGWALVTGDGSSKLGFTGLSVTSGDTAYFGAMSILAWPITDFEVLFEDSSSNPTHTNSATAEQTDVSTSGFTDIRSQDVTVEAGDYLVLMSVECFGMSSEGSTRHNTHFVVDGTELCFDTTNHFREELEDTRDRFNMRIARVHTFESGGDVTVAIQGRSENAAECDYGRSRIFLIPLAQFDQVVTNIDADGGSTTQSSFGTDAICTQAYTPNQDEYVWVIASGQGTTNVSNTGNTQLTNTTDAVNYCVDSGEYNNQSTGDSVPVALSAAPQLTAAGGAKTFEIQMRTNSGTYSIAGAELNLIGMTTVGGGGGTTLTPSPVSIPISVASPAVSLSLGLSPDPIQIAAQVADPVLALSLSISPDAVSIPIVAPDPSLAFALAITPDPVGIGINTDDPSIAHLLGISPDPVELVLVIPAPTIGAQGVLSPSPVAVAITAPDPSIALTFQLSPDPVLVPLQVAGPALSLSLSITPDPAQVPIVTAAPALSLSLGIAPEPIAIPLQSVSPSIALSLGITPDPVEAQIVPVSPQLALQLGLSPDSVQVALVVPIPSVFSGEIFASFITLPRDRSGSTLPRNRSLSTLPRDRSVVTLPRDRT